MAYKRKGLIGTKKLGRPYKYMQLSYDQSADRAFNVIGRLAIDAQKDWDTLSLKDKMNLVATLAPIAMKRIPDKHINTTTSYNISEETAKAMLAEAHRNLLIYKELHEEDKLKAEQNRTSDNQQNKSIDGQSSENVSESGGEGGGS